MSKSVLHTTGIRWNRLLPAILATIALACAIGLAGCGQTDATASSSEAASSAAAAPSGQAPDKPEGNQPPDKPDGNQPPDKPEGEQPGGPGGPG